MMKNRVGHCDLEGVSLFLSLQPVSFPTVLLFYVRIHNKTPYIYKIHDRQKKSILN